MQNQTSLNVLPLDKKIQTLNKNDIREKSFLKPNYSRDENLTDFGKATLLDRYLLPGEKFQDMFLRVSKCYSDDDNHAKRMAFAEKEGLAHHRYYTEIVQGEHNRLLQTLSVSGKLKAVYEERMALMKQEQDMAKETLNVVGKFTVTDELVTPMRGSIAFLEKEIAGLEAGFVNVTTDAARESLANVIQAKQEELDLIEISPNANPPVCKIMDMGKHKYDLQKKANQAKKKQKTVSLKEIKLRPGTETHDYNFKIKNAKKFITKGDKVKFTVKFKGREMQHTELGKDLMNRIIEETKDIAKVESQPKFEGRQMVMIIQPI